MQHTLGHRERCGFVQTGRPGSCNCGYIKSIEKAFQARWDTSYWTVGSSTYEYYARLKVLLEEKRGKVAS